MGKKKETSSSLAERKRVVYANWDRMGWVGRDDQWIYTPWCQRSSGNFQQQRSCPIYLKAYCIWILHTLISSAHPCENVNGSKAISLHVHFFNVHALHKHTHQQRSDTHSKAHHFTKSPQKVISGFKKHSILIIFRKFKSFAGNTHVLFPLTRSWKFSHPVFDHLQHKITMTQWAPSEASSSWFR